MRPAWDALVPAWVLYALLATLLLSLNIPPYENADEVNHFFRADQVSRGRLVGERFDNGQNSGGLVSPGIQASARPVRAAEIPRERQVTRGLLDQVERSDWRGTPVMGSFANTSIYPPLLYAPSVVAIWVGKLTRMPVVRTLYLARLLTGLVSCGLIAVAISICVRASAVAAGLLIFALAALPMSLELESACSQDGLMLALSALAGALFAQARNRPRAGGVGWMSLCLALVAMARPPYIALALVPLAAPGGRASRWGGAVLVAAACLAWVAIAGLFAEIDTTAGHGANISAQLHMLLNPAHDAALIAGTWQNVANYLTEFVGKLGWLDTDLPRWYVKAALGLLILVALTGLRGERPAAGPASLVLLGAVLSGLLVFLVQYLTWTQVGLTFVDGVAGRYFLPLALVLAGLASGLPRGMLDRSVLLVMLLFPAISLDVVMRAVIVRYYLGS